LKKSSPHSHRKNSKAQPGCSTQSSHARHKTKYWEIIADNLSKAGWSWGCVSAIDSNGRTIFVADAHRDNGKRFVVHANEKLTAFLELEAVIRTAAELFLTNRQDFIQTRRRKSGSKSGGALLSTLGSSSRPGPQSRD
jgi:hypothetical protein